jgi:hypothetical protein
MDEVVRNKIIRELELLDAREPIPTVFTPCGDVLLSLVDHPIPPSTPTTPPTTPDRSAWPEIEGMFGDYFEFVRHHVFHTQDPPSGDPIPATPGVRLNADLVAAMGGAFETGTVLEFPPPTCAPRPGVTLGGARHLIPPKFQASPLPEHDPPPPSPRFLRRYLQRLYVADAVWLFFMERMGTFKVLGALLDDFASVGRFPLRAGDHAATILEILVRQAKTGISSTVRDRDSSYRRVLGWTSDVGRKLGGEATVNRAFDQDFHRFIAAALGYFRERRIANVITTSSSSFVNSLTTIGEIGTSVRRALDPFKYGRNHANVLNGIVYVVSTMTLLRSLQSSLGIPPGLTELWQYFEAAYDILVAKAPLGSSNGTRFTPHRDCARHGRALVLDLQVVDLADRSPGGALERWLNDVGPTIEAYHANYLALTKVDLAAPGAVAEQRV